MASKNDTRKAQERELAKIRSKFDEQEEAGELEYLYVKHGQVNGFSSHVCASSQVVAFITRPGDRAHSALRLLFVDFRRCFLCFPKVACAREHVWYCCIFGFRLPAFTFPRNSWEFLTLSRPSGQAVFTGVVRFSLPPPPLLCMPLFLSRIWSSIPTVRAFSSNLRWQSRVVWPRKGKKLGKKKRRKKSFCAQHSSFPFLFPFCCR